MNKLNVVAFVPPKRSYRGTKKTGKRFNLTINQLSSFAQTYGLSAWEKDLVEAVDIKGLTFAHIARSMGSTRQYVHQEYSRIYNKVIGKGFSA